MAGSTYYSPEMAALPPPAERRRPRRGSLERPVNARMYRGTWLLVGLPLLVAAFSVTQPARCRRRRCRRVSTARRAPLARGARGAIPDRVPGPQGARERGDLGRRAARPYGFSVREDRFEATFPGSADVKLRNVIAGARAARQTIVVMAHRDDTGVGPGANDNASGTAALVELARAYATSCGRCADGPRAAAHTIVFLSTDGGAFGGLGAARFAGTSQYRDRTVAVVNLDALAGTAPPRLEIAGDRPRSPAAALVQTAAERILEQTGREPAGRERSSS